MTKVFIGGSRKLTKLPSLVTERLANIMQNGFQVLVGDANGADKAVQAYFAFQDYRQVAVFHTDKICRNNLGNWKTTSILAPAGKLTFKAYTLKDEAMAQAANYGFMLWDAKSKGTLNNLINLLTNSLQIFDWSYYQLGSDHI